ncbi:MAG: putative bacterial non-heme ferritin [Calditrichaeota bacterium]|nr:putative bacterial non-heme ferritin [Calditrichota bacterium]
MNLSKKMRDALNQQMTFELESAYAYMAMSAWFKTENLDGLAAFMATHAQEEVEHAMKFYDFLYERLSSAEFGAIGKPKGSFKNPLEVIETAFEHEQKVTRAIHQLVDLARAENDKASENFLQWFVEEQVEEESVIDNLLQRLKLVGDFKPGLFFLDRELAAEGGEH